MDNEAILPLSDAPHWFSKARFRPLLAFPPFIAGIFTGVLVGSGIIKCGPSLPLWSDEVLSSMLAGVGVVLFAWYALMVLLAIACFSSTPRLPRRWIDSLLLGAALPIFVMGFGQLIHAIFGLTPANNKGESLGTEILAIPAAFLAISLPFFLTRASSNANSQQNPSPMRRNALVIIGVSLAAISTAVVMQWQQARTFEKNCEELAAWIAVNSTAKSLPAKFQGLANEITWTSLADGRVVVLLKTSPFWHDNCDGVIYSSGPIQANEISKDYYGRPELSLPGLRSEGGAITRQVDNRHFVVTFDLG